MENKTSDKRTAEEILDKITIDNRKSVNKQLTYAYTHKEVRMAMEEYASQYRYDYSKSCKCKDTIGSTWCCNKCGLPTERTAIV